MIPVIELPETMDELLDCGWEKLDAGCSRQVFFHPDRLDTVLKFARVKIRDNKRECDLWEEHSEGALSFMLTPILGRNENYSAILMKRLTVFSWRGANEENNHRAGEARSRELLKVWRQHFGIRLSDDFHIGNWGQIADDYGLYIPGPLIDYAGVE